MKQSCRSLVRLTAILFSVSIAIDSKPVTSDNSTRSASQFGTFDNSTRSASPFGTSDNSTRSASPFRTSDDSIWPSPFWTFVNSTRSASPFGTSDNSTRSASSFGTSNNSTRSAFQFGTSGNSTRPDSRFRKNFTRAKRGRPAFSNDIGPNNYKEVPDLLDGPSPSPGLGLDIRILESDDGQYHGQHLRYRGEAADLMATTPVSLVESRLSTLINNVSREDLRLLQSRFNRWRIDQAAINRPLVTTPVIALILDPNYNPVLGAPSVPDSRRMMGSGYLFPTPELPPEKFRLNPARIIEAPVLSPFIYSPFATLPPAATPVTPEENMLSPLELFRRLYLNTTKRRIRTRKPRPKTPARMQPKKDGEHIQEDGEVDDTTSIIQTYKPDETEEEEDRVLNIPGFGNPGKVSETISEIEDKDIIPNYSRLGTEDIPLDFINAEAKYEKPKDSIPDIPRRRSEGRAPDTIHEETKYEKPTGMIPHIPSLRSKGRAPDTILKEIEYEKPKDMIPDIPRPKSDDNASDNTYVETEYEKPKDMIPDIPNPEIKEIVGKIKNTELLDEEEFEAATIRTSILEKPEIKQVEKELMKELVSYKAVEIPKEDNQGVTEIDLDSDQAAFKELMRGPDMELKSENDDGDGQMDEKLKALLMPEGELNDATKSSDTSNSSDSDYMEMNYPEEIKDLPIR